MASKRRLRKKEMRRCLDKQGWPSQVAALAHVNSLLARNRKDPMTARAGFLTAYRCKLCGAWHIGNAKGSASTGIFIDKLKRKGVIPPG